MLYTCTFGTSLTTRLKWGECRSPSEEIGPKPLLGLGGSGLVEQKQIYYTKNISVFFIIFFVVFNFLFLRKKNFLYFQSGKHIWFVEKKKSFSKNKK